MLNFFVFVLAMAEIQRIGHDHQALFFLFLFVLDLKQWHKAKTSCHLNILPRTPKIFTDSEPPIKWLIGGLIRGAPDPLTPSMGDAKYFWGDYDWLTILTPIESTFFLKPLTSHIFSVIFGESPNPPTPCIHYYCSFGWTSFSYSVSSTLSSLPPSTATSWQIAPTARKLFH